MVQENRFPLPPDLLTQVSKQRVYVIDLDKPLLNGWNYIGCVCEFADSCQMTCNDILKGVTCKASQAYQQS